jgi:hypothetical protein
VRRSFAQNQIQNQPPAASVRPQSKEIPMKPTMRIPAFLFTIALLALSGTARAITWGEVDSDNRYPYVGAIVGMQHPETGKPFVFCSGSLVHPRVLLTAGHGSYFLETALDEGLITLDNVRVSFGRDALDPKSWLEVEDVITHPKFQPGLDPKNDPADVGALVLKKPVRKIEPAILADEGLLDLLQEIGELREGPEGGTRFTVVGYGATLEFPPPELVAPDGWRRYAESEYLGLTDVWLVVSRNQAAGDAGTANGDSGGPILWKNPETGEEIVVGITSWGDPEKVATTFKYRADIAQTLDFVDAVIAAVEDGEL